MIFFSFDADNAGRKVGQAALSDDPALLHSISMAIDHGESMISDWAKSRGGIPISLGGDQGIFGFEQDISDEIEHIRKDYELQTGFTITVGIGDSLSKSSKALIVGKLRGKNQICQYDPQIEQEYVKAQQAANDGTATGEGKKLGEAYMKDNQNNKIQNNEDSHSDCQYCAELASDNAVDDDHCKYCHDEPALEDAAAPHCEYCAQAEQQNAQHDINSPDHGDDCQYCADAVQRDHEHSGDDCQYCLESQSGSDHDHTGDDCQYCAESAQNNAPVDNQTTDDQSLQQIAQEIEQTTPGGETPSDVLANMDGPGDMPGTIMQDNVSHPENYGNAAPSDMGMAEEEVPESGPDLSSVLAGGLDNHADNIQREKVVQMVSEALQGFKACKPIIERAQQQAPQLYESSIAMLRAMIEMAKMLGLAPKPEEAQEAIPQEQAAPQQTQGAPAPAPQQGETSAGKTLGR